MLVASTFMLWTVATLLLIAVVAQARQLRVLQHGMSALQPTAAEKGAVGARCPPIVAHGPDDRPLLLGTPQAGSCGLLMLLLPSLPLPEPLIELAQTISAAQRIDLICIGKDMFDPPLAAAIAVGAVYVRSRSAFSVFEAGALPLAVLVRPDCVIAAMQAVRCGDDLDGLVAAGRRPPFAERSEAIAIAGIRRAARECAA